MLAIVAAKRGAVHVDAVDIDDWAYENSRENIAENGVQGRVTPLLGDVSAIAGKRYDFILANINRNILLADMPRYAQALREGGELIMSGILERDVEAIGERAVGARSSSRGDACSRRVGGRGLPSGGIAAFAD